MKRLALILFFIAVAGQLLVSFADAPIVHQLSKPLIMIALALFYYSATTGENRSNLVMLAVAFSFAGDVLLMGESYFVFGLVAFLLSHVFYILSYKQHVTEESDYALKNVHKVRLAFPIILAATGLVVILYPVLGDLKVPVILYAIVLALMVLQALYRYGRTNSRSFWYVFIGACFFMVSDSVLAINKFLQPLDHAGFWIMLTYMTAQFLIINGFIFHFEKHRK